MQEEEFGEPHLPEVTFSLRLLVSRYRYPPPPSAGGPLADQRDSPPWREQVLQVYQECQVCWPFWYLIPVGRPSVSFSTGSRVGDEEIGQDEDNVTEVEGSSENIVLRRGSIVGF